LNVGTLLKLPVIKNNKEAFNLTTSNLIDLGRPEPEFILRIRTTNKPGYGLRYKIILSKN